MTAGYQVLFQNGLANFSLVVIVSKKAYVVFLLQCFVAILVYIFINEIKVDIYLQAFVLCFIRQHVLKVISEVCSFM